MGIAGISVYQLYIFCVNSGLIVEEMTVSYSSSVTTEYENPTGVCQSGINLTKPLWS